MIYVHSFWTLPDSPAGMPPAPQLTGSRVPRRQALRYLFGTGAMMLSAVSLAACGSSSATATTTVSTAATASGAPTTGAGPTSATVSTTSSAPASAGTTSATVSTASKAIAATTSASSQVAVRQSGTTQIEIWEQQASITAASGAAKAFETAHPDIKLNWVPTPIPETATKLLTTIAAGSGAPDLAFIQYTDMVKFTVRNGVGLVDLSTYMNQQKYNLSDWPQWVLQLVTTKDKKILGLSADIGVEATFYRRDVFDAAKLPSDPASVAKALKSWNDYILTGSKVAGAGLYMLDNASAVFDIVRQQGKQGYFDDNGNPVVNSPEFVAAAEQALKVRQAKLDLQPTSAAGEATAMQQGKVATYFSAAWFDIIIHAEAPKTLGHWGVVPLPGGASANSGGSYYCLPAMGKQHDAAWTVASFMLASKEGLVPYLEGIKFLPGWKPIYTEDPVFTSPDPNYAGQVWLTQFVDNADNVPIIALNVNDPIASAAVTQAITNILHNGAPIQQTLDNANNQIKQGIRTA